VEEAAAAHPTTGDSNDERDTTSKFQKAACTIVGCNETLVTSSPQSYH
jgi:hypothetical protein